MSIWKIEFLKFKGYFLRNSEHREVECFIKSLLAQQKEEINRQYLIKFDEWCSKNCDGERNRLKIGKKIKQEIIKEFIEGKRCYKCGKPKESIVMDLCDECYDTLRLENK